MQIIFGKENADNLRDRYTVLELETIEKDGITIDAYCLIPGELIKIEDLPHLAKLIELHEQFVQANKDKDYTLCNQLAPLLLGQFGGELDSFYREIITRV